MKFWPMRTATERGYRSGLEEKIADQLEDMGVPFDYEGHTLRYEIPAREARYTPDFILPNAIIIETKGRFVTSDRKKHKLIRKQHPNLDIRIVFSNPNAKIGKRSKTTYGMWCEQHGIPYAHKTIPQEWIDEPLTRLRRDAVFRVCLWQPPS
ncbi:MAG: endodeoxyribonuclease [bacterium]